MRPLLPGSGPHRVVVTSRDTLAGLEARLVDVTVLDDANAVALLDAALRVTRPDDSRISSDQENARRLAGSCSGLPLALQIVAALLKADLILSASELADELEDERNRLERLRYEDGRRPDGLSVEAAFELSYRRLKDGPARVFRLFPVTPGPDLSTDSAVILADLRFYDVRNSLGFLAKAHLIEAAPSVAGRWWMHDLVRLYAQRLSDAHADSDDRERARDRLLSYYLRMTRAAVFHILAYSGVPLPREFVSRDDALAWLDAEKSSLVAAVRMADGLGKHQTAFDLSVTLDEYLSWRRYADKWIATATIGLHAARELGDRYCEAGALNNLSIALGSVRRLEEAVAAHRYAAAMFRRIGARHAEGAAMYNL